MNEVETAEVKFNEPTLKRFQEMVVKYERPQSALLPTLWLAQEQFGFLTPNILKYVAKLLEMPPAKVFEAASFYFMFHKKDMGKYCVQVCNNITCHMMGAGELLTHVQSKLGIRPGEVAKDKSFSLKVVQCLGACDHAPVLQVNDDYVNDVTPERFDQLLASLDKTVPLSENAMNEVTP